MGADDRLGASCRVVAFGGGTGLGRTLAALRDLGERLTAIVATTDDGGHTGWLRKQSGGIAWGDVRNCLNQVIDEPTLGSLLFEYRFIEAGELSGHSLGNLILLALDQMSPRPLHAIDLVRELLGVEIRVMPMSERPTQLHAETASGEILHGEMRVDSLADPPDSVWLSPAVVATPEAVSAVSRADLITIGPGSFVTSVLPSLLVGELRSAIVESGALKVLIANRQPEEGPMRNLSYMHQIEWMESILGVRLVDVVLWPSDRPLPADGSDRLRVYDVDSSENIHRHDAAKLRAALESLVADFAARGLIKAACSDGAQARNGL